jgi:hypothetical protein
METPERASQGTPPRTPKRRWLKRLAAALLVLVLIAACGAVVGYRVVFGGRKASVPYQMALEKVRHDPQVIALLGEPVDDAEWFPTGNVQQEGDRGIASLHFRIAGPKAQARVSVQARRVDGRWGLTMLDVLHADGERIRVDTTSAGGVDEAPRWSPPGADESPAEPEADAPSDLPGATPETETDIQLELPELPNLR